MIAARFRLIAIDSDTLKDGLNVVVWGKWTKGSMRVRRFRSRSGMIETLESLGLVSRKDREALESFVYTDTCPLYSVEIDESVLAAHGFEAA